MRRLIIFTAFSITLNSPLLAQKLAENKQYQSGISALKDNLGELALNKFKIALADQNLTANDKQALQLLIAESYIRTSLPALALQTLQDESLVNHPDKMFWSGIATASAGRYQDAIVILQLVKKGSNHFTQARLTLASLYQALSDTENARLLYTELANEKNSHSEYSKLRLAELLIEKGSIKDATQLLTELKTESAPILKKKTLLEAKINLSNKEYSEAINKLTALLESPEHLDELAINNVVITLADARYAKGDTSDALDGILTFLDKHKTTAALSPLFARIGRWLPKDTKLNDPSLLKLKEWAGRDNDPLNPNKEHPNNSELTAYAHYYYTTLLANSADPASLSKALFEFTLLRLNHPTHITFGMSLMQTAKIQLKLEQSDAAIDTLKNILTLNIPLAPEAKQQAAFILGQILADKTDYPSASAAFQIASNSQQESLANAATINAGIAYLEASDLENYQSYWDKTNSLVLKQQLELEKALWLAKNKSIDARLMLQSFIKDYPDNPRVTEAQLALADNTIRVSPTDPVICGQMINTINASRITPQQYIRFANIRYLHAMSQKEYPAAIEIARQLLETDQPDERKIEFKLLLGQAYYRDGQHNPARQILRQLIYSQPDSPLADYALYYSALAARLEGTPQSKKEAIDLFHKLTDNESPISTEATLQLSDLYSRENQPELAHQLLAKIYNPKLSSNIQRDIAVKLASTLQALGASNEKHYNEAIKVYDQLLAQKDLPIFWKNQIHFRKGQTYEKMNKNQEAVNTYYAIIDVDHNKKPITEWKWYYRCGDNAIQILKELGNPKAAISVAKRLASTNGPKAKENAKRARDIEMDYMIWDSE